MVFFFCDKSRKSLTFYSQTFFRLKYAISTNEMETRKEEKDKLMWPEYYFGGIPAVSKSTVNNERGLASL